MIDIAINQSKCQYVLVHTTHVSSGGPGLKKWVCVKHKFDSMK